MLSGNASLPKTRIWRSTSGVQVVVHDRICLMRSNRIMEVHSVRPQPVTKLNIVSNWKELDQRGGLPFMWTCGKLAGIISDKRCNLLTKFASKRRLGPVTNVNQCKGLARFGMTYRHIRNAEVRGSIPLCSTINSNTLSDLQPSNSGGRSSFVGNLRECFSR